MKEKIKEIYAKYEMLNEKEVTVCGWIKNLRDSKVIAFIELNDGSSFKGVQIVLNQDSLSNYKDIVSLNIGSSLRVTGKLVITKEAKQPFEIVATNVQVEGKSTPDFPLQNKRHSMEFLRDIAHLRGRTNTFMAVNKVRGVLSYEIHKFFNDKGFLNIHTPIITSSDCEGAGEMFRVTTLEDTTKDASEDFFGKKAHLTVSGQLLAECLCMGASDVYTFGPTFRAENSNTTRHAAEFWMIEPEMAFADLQDDMNVAEDMLKTVIKNTMEKCKDEIEFFNNFVSKGLIEKLTNVVTSDFGRVTYTEAVEILKKYNDKFEYKVEWGTDLQTEHERFLTEEIYKKPVFVTNYPKEIKSFYMKLDEDKKTVSAMDLLVPGIGEIIGGSQREENYEVLVSRMVELGLDPKEYEWYLDLRKYGTCKHAGFGLGFERLIMYVTGMGNIRDVIPFPRTPGNLNY